MRYHETHPEITNSGFKNRKFGKVEVLQVRSTHRQAGGSGRIAILSLDGEKRVALYGRVTYAERLLREEGAIVARQYMRSVFDEATPVKSKSVPSTKPTPKLVQVHASGYTKPNAIGRKPKVSAEPTSEHVVNALRATADVVEFLNRLENDPVTRAAWDELSPTMLK